MLGTIHADPADWYEMIGENAEVTGIEYVQIACQINYIIRGAFKARME